MRYIRLPVTKTAKIKVRRALKLRSSLPESKKFGIDKEEANKLGIESGVERAKQLSRSDSIPYEDAERVAAFKRFLGRPRTQKIQGSIDLWGGEEFINKADSFVKSSKRARGYVRRL